MREINGFKFTTIFLSYGITALLVMAILSLFFLTAPADVWRCLASEEMLFSLKLSVITAFFSTVFVMLFAVAISYALSRYEFPGKRMVRSIMNLPVAFPELVLGLCLLQLFGGGYSGDAFRALGVDIVFTRTGIVVAQFFTALPYAVRIMKATFDVIPTRLEFVARSLGYTPFETFMQVTIPLSGKGLLASLVLAFARSIGAFGSVLILSGGSYMKTEVLPVTLYLNISYANMPMAMTSGMLLIVISFLAIFIFEKADVNL